MSSDARAQRVALLEAMENLSGTHREHEKFYSVAPLDDVIRLHRYARTLHALADRWSALEPASKAAALSPFEGATDLNDPTATQLDGVLFMEGEAEPAEIAQMKRDLRATAERALAGAEYPQGYNRCTPSGICSMHRWDPTVEESNGVVFTGFSERARRVARVRSTRSSGRRAHGRRVRVGAHPGRVQRAARRAR